MFLLVLKSSLEGLTKRVPPEEIFTFTKFLLLTAVVLRPSHWHGDPCTVRQPHLFAGGTLIASGMMYLRLALLLALFNHGLLLVLGLPFLCLAVSALLAGWIWSTHS